MHAGTNYHSEIILAFTIEEHGATATALPPAHLRTVSYGLPDGELVCSTGLPNPPRTLVATHSEAHRHVENSV